MNDVTIYKPKTPVEMRREMATDAAVISVLDPLEKAVFLASTAKTFAEYNTNELAADLTKALRFIFKDTGYRSTDESELGYLVVRVCEIVKRYYPGFTLKDFRMAFEMSITGELDDYLPKGRDGQADRGHYQQFNAEYVCKILNAYKARRAWVLKKANDAKPKPEPIRNEELEKYYRNWNRREMISCYEDYKKTGRIPEMSPIAEMLYYNSLVELGLADDVEITVDDQKHILQRTINDFARRGMVGDMRRLEQAGTDAPEIRFGAYMLSRQNALKAAFARMRDTGVELADYIKFE